MFLRKFLFHLGENSDASMLLDSHLRTILENVKLVYLLQREEGGWDADVNWEDILSLGEQQRLGMVNPRNLITVNRLIFMFLRIICVVNVVNVALCPLGNLTCTRLAFSFTIPNLAFLMSAPST